MKKELSFIVGFLTIALVFAFFVKTGTPRKQLPPVVRVQPQPVVPQPVVPKEPRSPNISEKIPAYQDYAEILQQLKKWNQEAPDLTEVNTYGNSKRGQPLYYIRVCNNVEKKDRPKLLITACIHGNEPWSTGVVMGYIGTLLGDYATNKEIKELVDSRDIYFIPVVSPDSYPHSRHVDGVDPNRDFPHPNDQNHKSTPSIEAIRKLFLEIKPQAAISGHTSGRMFLIPYGNSMSPTVNESDYQRIVGQMARMANYRLIHACEIYGRPIFGGELDWYYQQGSFSMVIEYGTHQQKPNHEQIKSEFARTWEAVKLFIKEAPLVRCAPKNN